MQDFARSHSTNIVKMVSLDVVSLFTRVPVQDVLNFLDRKIDAGDIVLPIPKAAFIGLVELCVNNNVFEFNGRFFKQKFGISMGSPLSPVLANLYMEYLESELLPSISPQPPLYVRYVDDILIAWPDSMDFDHFFDQVNLLSRSIKFTKEWEIDQSIPFLDTRVHRLTSGFSFGIYRKPTHSGQYIHFFSSQSEQIKRGSVFSMYLRAYRLCDGSHLQNELNYLAEAFQKSGFPARIIREVHSAVKRKFYSAPPQSTPEESQPPPTIALPHSHFVEKHVKPLFRANGSRVVTSSTCTLRNELVSNRPPCGEGVGGSVYLIPCHDCEKVYVGQSGRNFDVRLGEHKAAVRLGRVNNACAKHSVNENHAIDWRNARTLYKSNDLTNRLIVQSTLIKSRENFNNMQSTLTIENLAANTIIKSNRCLQAPD